VSLYAGIPNARLRAFERRGHNAHSEQTAEVMEAACGFLAGTRGLEDRPAFAGG
jgi:hypothetical protein